METIHVTVPRNERKWWKKNRVYPVAIQLDFGNLRASIGEREFRIYEDDGAYRVAVRTGSSYIEAGRFTETRVYRTLSVAGMRDLKALRAAIYNTDYQFVMAVRTPKGLVHAGACAKGQGQNLYTVKGEATDEDDDLRCGTCGEGFV